MKYLLLSALITVFVFSCKKEENKSINLQELIKNKDAKALQIYKDRQQFKIDSINKSLEQVNQTLLGIGIHTAAVYVQVVPLQQEVFQHFLNVQGNVTTDQNVVVMPQFSGTLKLNVKEGQMVSRGQAIGSIDDGGLKQNLNSAKIQLDLARVTFTKISNLWKQKIGSEMQLLQAKTNYEVAQRQVAGIQEQLKKTVIIAPFSGVIDQVLTQNGQFVSPGSQVVKLINLSTMKVVADVSESYLSKVKRGTSVEIFLPAINQTIKTNINLVGNFINPTNRTFKVEIPVQNYGGVIKPNLLAEVKIQDYLNASTIVVEAPFVYEDAEHKNFVYVAHNKQANEAIAKKVIIEKGNVSENKVEITSGLTSGEMLITDGGKSISDGQKVKY